MKGRVLMALALAASLAGAAPAAADGTLPPQPYNYLHPPAALAATNQRPSAGTASIPLTGGRQVAQGTAFTADGQAGISAPPGAFRGPRTATQVQLRIQPVNTPAHLPSGFTGDGNAYRILAAEQPGGEPVSPQKPLSLVLRFPLVPHAIYQYRAHRWRRLCLSDDAQVISATLIICRATTLGTFLAVLQKPGKPALLGFFQARRLQRLQPADLTEIVDVVGGLDPA